MKKIFSNKNFKLISKFPSMQKRNMITGISFFIKVALIGGSSAFVFWYNKLSRSTYAQIKRMQKEFSFPPQIEGHPLYLERKDIENTLRNRFKSSPNAPLVLIGF